jgi:hypothetical protein
MASQIVPSADASAGRRRHSRLRVHLPARLITLDGTLHATLVNLSFRGAKVTLTAASASRGASAVLTWGSFEAFCTVSWSQGQMCGLDFDEPLKPQVLIATRDLADATPPVDASRVAARNWAVGLVNR